LEKRDILINKNVNYYTTSLPTQILNSKTNLWQKIPRGIIKSDLNYRKDVAFSYTIPEK